MARLFTSVFIALLILAGSAFPESDTATPQDTGSNAAVMSTEQAPAKPVDSSFQYPLSPERKELLISYARFNNIWRFVDFFVGIGLLAVVLFTGLSARFRNWAAVGKRRFFVMWLYLVQFAVAMYLLGFPFSYYREFIVESKYGFMNQTFVQWFVDSLKSLAVTVIIGILPLWLLYFVIERFKRWWLWFSLGSIPLLILLVVIAPVFISPLFNKFEPLKDKVLEARILALADKAGIEGSRVFEVDASRQSSKINAYVTGLFGTKRIVLYDTIIKDFTSDEIAFVMGHEMGHYVKHHIWWGLGVAVLVLFGVLWLTDRTIHKTITRFQRSWKFDRLTDVASLPLVLVFTSVISFVIQPINNGCSRYFEHQSDKFGMEISGVSGDVAATAFDKLSAINLSDPEPSALVEFWFYDHPAPYKRMAYVRGYKPGQSE